MAATVDKQLGLHRAALGTAGNCTRVDLPTWAAQISIQAEDYALKVSFSGTDGGALGSHYFNVAAGATAGEIGVRPPANRATGRSIYISSDTNSAVFVVLCEPSR